EDGIRDATVTGVQTCALPIFTHSRARNESLVARIGLNLQPKIGIARGDVDAVREPLHGELLGERLLDARQIANGDGDVEIERDEIGRASCRESVESTEAGAQG